MFCSLVVIKALLALLFFGQADPMEDYLFWNSVKLVYCDRIKATAIFRMEDLAENCVIKVDFFDQKVSARVY